MSHLFQNTEKACSVIRAVVNRMPEILIITGTGLGKLSENMKKTISIEYSDIPGFPESTVKSHSGRLIFGELNGKETVLMMGRFHLYEGYSAQMIAFPVRTMKDLGVKTMIITNASGGINLSYKEGSIMLIEDHINLTGFNPLIGVNDDSRGPRFPDMINAYDPGLRKNAEIEAKKSGIDIVKGVYAGLAGPSLETPAEIRFLKAIGADSVGFSTVQEVITAVHSGIKVLGLSVITNINNPDKPVPATLEEVIAVAEKRSPLLSGLIENIIGALNEKKL